MTAITMNIAYRVENPELLIEIARDYLAGCNGYDADSAAEVIETADDALEELFPTCPYVLAQYIGDGSPAMRERGARRLEALCRAVEETGIESVDIIERMTHDD